MSPTNSALVVRAPQTAAGTNAELRPLRGPVEIPTGWEWLWWTLAILALIALIVVGVIYLRRYLARRPAAVAPPEPPYVRARRRLEAALRLLSEPQPYCTEVSDTLRVYLEERFELRAPERTTEEFLRDLQRTSALNQKQKQSLAGFLEQCDLVKFAKFEPPEVTLRELRETALRIVDETAYESIPALAPAASKEGEAA